MPNLKKYVGREYEGYNCFDLVKEFYEDQFEICLGQYWESNQPIPDRSTIESLIVSKKGNFKKVVKPEFGDIVVIKLYGLECHIGVMVNHVQFLHSARGAGSHLSRIDKYEKLIAGFYRHVDRDYKDDIS